MHIPSVIYTNKKEHIVALLAEGVKVTEIAKELNLSTGYVHRVKHDFKGLIKVPKKEHRPQAGTLSAHVYNELKANPNQRITDIAQKLGANPGMVYNMRKRYFQIDARTGKYVERV